MRIITREELGKIEDMAFYRYRYGTRLYDTASVCDIGGFHIILFRNEEPVNNQFIMIFNDDIICYFVGKYELINKRVYYDKQELNEQDLDNLFLNCLKEDNKTQEQKTYDFWGDIREQAQEVMNSGVGFISI